MMTAPHMMLPHGFYKRIRSALSTQASEEPLLRRSGPAGLLQPPSVCACGVGKGPCVT